MLDLAALLFDVFLCVRLARAVRNRVLLPAAATQRGSADWIVIPVDDTTLADDGLVDRIAGDPTRSWVVLTEPGVGVSESLIASAIVRADELGLQAVTARGRAEVRGPIVEAVAQSVSAWTGEGVDPHEFADAADRRALGFDELLAVRREAFLRIGGLTCARGEPCRARAVVRGLKRAGLRVLIGTAVDGLILEPRSVEWWARSAVARYHSLVPAGRVGPFLIALLVTICGVRPWVAASGGWSGLGASPTSFALAVVTCGALALHRVLFDRLTARSSASLWALPLALLVAAGAAWVCALQRLLGLDARFGRVARDRGPDHTGGVDYKAVYTERYFDGVDSRFSPCGFRDDARYYERLLEPLLELRGSGRALDVGCGYGYLTRRLARHFDTAGIDVSEAAIRKCRETLPHLEFAVHEVEEPFPMAPETFDVVTLTDVLEHLVDPERMLRNVHRVLAPGGILYVTTPNLNRLRRWLYAEADRREHHVSLMSRRALVDVLERSGFRVLRSWTYVSAYMLPGRFRSDVGPETGVLCEKVNLS